jgi:uncharacterized protein YifN (PemK superfamily)
MKLRERDRGKKKQYLDRSLTPEQLVFTKIICWAQKHIDHDVVKVRLAPLAPFQDDEKREVPKQGIQKQKLRDELIPGKKTDTQRVCQEKIH